MSICVLIRHLSLSLSLPLQSSELNFSPLILSINSMQLHLQLHMHSVTGNGIRKHTIEPYRIRFWGFSRNANRLFLLHLSPAEKCEGESSNLHFRFIYINHIHFLHLLLDEICFLLLKKETLCGDLEKYGFCNRTQKNNGISILDLG